MHPALAWARRHTLLTTLGTIALLVTLYAAMAPIGQYGREVRLDITPGTLARRSAGDIAGALPQTLPLTVGVRDVLHIRNNDVAPHFFGALALAPGEEIRIPFDQAGTRRFPSSAHFGASATVEVGPWPDPGMTRLRWRLREWAGAIRRY